MDEEEEDVGMEIGDESSPWSDGYHRDLDYTPSTRGKKSFAKKAKPYFLCVKCKIQVAYEEMDLEGNWKGRSQSRGR